MKRLKIILLIHFLITGIPFLTRASFSDLMSITLNKDFKTSNDTAKVNKYTRLALSFVSNPLKINYVKANIDTAELICEQQNVEFPSLLYLARAEYFYLTGDFNNASQEATIAMKKSGANGEADVLVRTMNFFGRYCLRTGFYKESIDYFNSSNDLAKKNRLKGFLPANYFGLANVYYTLENLPEYRNTLQILIDAAKSENDTLFLETGYYYLGTSLTEKERDFKRADSILRKSLEISLKKNDTAFIARSLSNLGWNYYREKNYDSAIQYYNKSLTYSIPARIYSNSANSFGNLGTIYRDIGNTETALINYLKAIYQAKTGKDIYDLSWVYGDMSEMYLRKKDTANAFKNYVLFKQYSDSMLMKNNIKNLADARIKYDADTHNKELELLSLRIRNQRLLIYGSSGLFLLSLAILILLLSRAKLNTRRRISEMNRKISEITQANLRQQMNPHFIFNTLNSIQYYMYQHDKLATNNYLTKFSSLMRKVLENSQHTSVSLRDELDALNLYLELEMIRFKDKFSYTINVDEEIDTLLYKVPTMLIQPYVENSICHGLIPGEGKGSIKIDLKLRKDYILCIIEDNGIGREAAQKINRMREKNHHSLGTQIVSSRLDLVNALYGTSLKTIYTDLKSDTNEPEGTRVEIHIPILT